MNGEQKQGLNNLAYDWTTIVQKKAKAVYAYNQYIRDAEDANASECVKLLKQIQDDDLRHLNEAKKHLQKTLAGQMGQS